MAPKRSYSNEAIKEGLGQRIDNQLSRVEKLEFRVETLDLGRDLRAESLLISVNGV